MANIPFVIQAGQSLSNAVSIGASQVVGVIIDPNWTAAGLSVLASANGVDFFSVQRSGNELVEPVNANKWADLSKCDFSGIASLKLQSGSLTNGLVNQTQTVTLGLITT